MPVCRWARNEGSATNCGAWKALSLPATRWSCSHVSIPRCRVIFILDEFDRISDPEVRAEVATLMKLLSDATIPVQLLIVGIAVNVDELLRDHASLRRHLAAVPVGRISPAAVLELIHRGAEQAGLSFDDRASELIAGISCGSPYHVRTFCAHAGLARAAQWIQPCRCDRDARRHRSIGRRMDLAQRRGCRTLSPSYLGRGRLLMPRSRSLRAWPHAKTW